MPVLNHDKNQTRNQGWYPVRMPTEMSCPRCKGLMVESSFLDLEDDTGQHEFWALRCVQCGNIVDPLIMKNQGEAVGAER